MEMLTSKMSSSLKIIPTKTKHKKLTDNLMEAKPVLIEGVSFTSKYIGMTLVDSPKGEDMAAAAVKRIFTANKASTKEAPLVQLTVSPKEIAIKDLSSEEMIDNISINRISFCTADKAIGKVFGYVAQNPSTEAFECHAYMCGSRKEAQRLTLAVAQAFTIAFEASKDTINDESAYKEATSDVPENTSTFNLESNFATPPPLPDRYDRKNSSAFSVILKKIPNIYRSITDSKYKRFSNSSLPSSDVKLDESHEKENTKEPLEKVGDFSLDFDIPTLSRSLPNKTPEVQVRKPSTSNVLISIMPPPSSKGKPSARSRAGSSSARLVNVPAQQNKNAQTPVEDDNTDFDFAELALSRTKDSSS